MSPKLILLASVLNARAGAISSLLSGFPCFIQEVERAALKANAHLKDLDEEIFDDSDFYHQVKEAQCSLLACWVGGRGGGQSASCKSFLLAC